MPEPDSDGSWQHPDAEDISRRLSATDTQVRLAQAERGARIVARVIAAHYHELSAVRPRLPRRVRVNATLMYAEMLLGQLHGHGSEGDSETV